MNQMLSSLRLISYVCLVLSKSNEQTDADYNQYSFSKKIKRN